MGMWYYLGAGEGGKELLGAWERAIEGLAGEVPRGREFYAF
jgi:hypothetical protein